jgi:hypothetical protein
MSVEFEPDGTERRVFACNVDCISIPKIRTASLTSFTIAGAHMVQGSSVRLGKDARTFPIVVCSLQ